MATVRCDACGSEVERTPSEIKNNQYNFCDKSCAGVFYSDEYSEADEYEDIIHELYWVDGLSVREVADELDKGKSTIDKYMRELDIPRRDRVDAIGDGVGMYTDKRGYEKLHARGHGATVEVRVHSLIAVANGADPSEVFGSNDGLVVHHRNGIPWDNRDCNLETMTQSKHASIHASM